MPLPSHLVKTHHGVYHFRQTVPQNLRPLFGQREIKFSLGTKCPQAAKRAAYSSSAKVCSLFELAKDQTVSAPTVQEILAKLKSGEARTYEIDIPGFGRIQADGVEDHQRALETLKQIEQIGALPSGTKQEPLAPSSEPEAKSISLSEAIAGYKIERENSGNRPKSVQQIESALRRLAKFLEHPSSIKTITRTDLAGYAQHLAADNLAKPTIKKHFDFFNGFFVWAISQGYYTSENPATGLVKYTAKQKRARRKHGNLPFTKSELATVFPAATKGARKPHTYWMPWIALYTGARANEIGQLAIADILCIDDLWCLNITDTGLEQSTKTESSKRLIPLPPQLIDMGLLDYWTKTASRGHRSLFPALKPTMNGKGAHVASKFCEKVRELGITSDTGIKGFHSLRTTLIQHLQDFSGVPDSHRMAYVGHELDSVHFQHYAKKIEPDKLAETIFPALEQF